MPSISQAPSLLDYLMNKIMMPFSISITPTLMKLFACTFFVCVLTFSAGVAEAQDSNNAIRDTYPGGCAIGVDEYEDSMREGFAWDNIGVRTKKATPYPGSILYTQIVNLICSGILPKKIKIRSTSDKVSDENGLGACEAKAQFHSGAKQRCEDMCKIQPNAGGGQRWTSGSECSSPPKGHKKVPGSDSLHHITVQGPDVGGGDGSFKSMQGADYCYGSQSDCAAAQASYAQGGLIAGIEHFCQQKKVVTGTGGNLGPREQEGWCFRYSSRVEPDEEDKISDDPHVCFGRYQAYMDSNGQKAIDEKAQESLDSAREKCGREAALYVQPRWRAQPSADSPECFARRAGMTGDRGYQDGRVWHTYQSCFNSVGFVKEDLSDWYEEQDAKRRESKAKEDSIDRINKVFTGAGGGLVPDCDETMTVVLANGNRVEQKIGCGWNDLIQLINNIVRFAIEAATVLMVVVCMWAGWGLITARGNATALTEARSRLLKSVTGLVIVLMAWAIVSAVFGLFIDERIFSGEDAELNILESIER